MRVSEGRGCLQTMPSVSILEQAKLGQTSDRPLRCSAAPPLLLFIAENIKKGDTLQTAASKPHGGISLYRDILANVLSTDKDTTSIPENQTENQDVAESVVVDENVTPEEKEGRVR